MFIKNFIFFCLLSLLVACGDIENKDGGSAIDRIGSAINTTSGDLLGQAQVGFLKKVCDSFEIKDGYVEGLFNDKTWVYDNSFIKCDLSSDTSSDVKMKISGSGSNKSFVLDIIASPGGKYYFGSYESHQQGLLSEICSEVATSNQVTQTQKVNNSLYKKFYISNGDTCHTNPNIICVDVDHAVKNQSGQYIVEYIHTLQVNTDLINSNQQRGFVYSRTLTEKCQLGVNPQNKPIYSTTKKTSNFKNLE